MFSASPSLAAKDTPRTGKKYQGVFAVSRRGGDKKTDGLTKNACFLHRMHQNERVAYTRSPSTVPRVHSVHQEAIYGTECYIGKNEKDIACAEFLKLPEKRRPSLKSGWQLPLKGLSTLGAGGRSRRRQVPR